MSKSNTAKDHRVSPRLRRRSGTHVSIIGETIQRERIRLGFTQSELARRLDVSLRVLRAVEQGNEDVTLSLVSKILTRLGLQLLPRAITFVPECTAESKTLRRENVMSILSAVFPVLRGKYHVQRLAVFGSTARDEARPDSDIDLLVSYDPALLPTERQRNDTALHL